MIIINQDRDACLHTHRNLTMKGEIVYYKNKPIGYNLIIDNNNMGTFDSLEELQQEVLRINNCQYKFYCISGFQDYNSNF